MSDILTQDVRDMSDEEFVAQVTAHKDDTYSDEVEAVIAELVSVMNVSRAITKERHRLLTALLNYEEEMGETKHTAEERVNEISTQLKELGLDDFQQYALLYRVAASDPDLYPESENVGIEKVFIRTKKGLDAVHNAADEAAQRERIERPKLVI